MRYFYTTEGQLQREDDLLSEKSRIYVYNAGGKVKEIGEFDTYTKLYEVDVSILYDGNGRVSTKYETIDYLASGAIKAAEVSNH